MNMLRAICFTSDKRTWLLRGFAHQWRKYAGALNVSVAGYTDPGPEATLGLPFYSIGKFEDYPFEKWSDGVIKFLDSIQDELIIWTMEDFWLLRETDIAIVDLLRMYMETHTDIARMDLSADRANNKEIVDIGSLFWLDLVESTPEIPYHFSYQMAIWRRKMLLECMRPGENPGQAEINGQDRLTDLGYRVLGTRQRPFRYLIAVQHGRLTFDGGYQGQAFGLHDPDYDELEGLGYLNEPK